MKKTKVLLYILLFSSVQSLFAQTQQGYVKTIGRPEKKGEALGGVAVRVKGEHNSVISEDDGTFSMPMANKKNGDSYTLQQVQKNGYELNENDIIGRPLAFSDKVPLTIVMVSSEQLQADKQRIENNAFAVAEKNFKNKYSLLEKQLADNEITIEKYQEEIQQLQKKFEKYQSLIAGLAEHYAHTDYDQLNEKDREINICIENGDLDRADSIICTLFDPIDVLKRNKEALAQIDMQIGQANEILAQAYEDMASVLRQQEKDAEYLFQLYTIALAKFDNEKALFYIETRAELDTTNPGWQFNAAFFAQEQNDFVQARKYYSRALELYRKLAKDNPKAYETDLASTLNNLAILYKTTQQITESENMYLEALENYKHMAKLKPERLPNVARTLNNLALLYSNTQRFEESEAMYQEALETFRLLASDNPQAFEHDIAMTLNHLAVLYEKTQRLTESENMHLEALKIHRRLAANIPKAHEPYVAMTLNYLADLYFNSRRLEECDTLYLEALDIYRRLTKDNPQVYEPNLVTTLSSLAILYYKTQRFNESSVFYLEALNIYRRLAKDNPQVFQPRLATTIYSIGLLHWQQEQYTQAIPAFEEALELYGSLSLHNTSYEKWREKSLYMLTQLYQMTDEHDKYLSANLERIFLLKKHYQDDTDTYRRDYARALGDQSFQSLFIGHWEESERFAREALSIDSSYYWFNTNLAASCLFQGKYAEADTIYRQYKNELKESFLQDLDVFEAAGIIPEDRQTDVEEIKKLLNE